AFDHTFLTYNGTSRYAQWWGWRRVTEELKRRVPEIVIDGRQAYQNYGPWSWLAGSYPHPTSTDEQPESFVPFPDLSFDRVSADRRRYTAYRYRLCEVAPSEIVPGWIGNQPSGADESGDIPSERTAPDGEADAPGAGPRSREFLAARAGGGGARGQGLGARGHDFHFRRGRVLSGAGDRAGGARSRGAAGTTRSRIVQSADRRRGLVVHR